MYTSSVMNMLPIIERREIKDVNKYWLFISPSAKIFKDCIKKIFKEGL